MMLSDFSSFLKALKASNFLAPPSIASSEKASRVPEVGGGPITSILTAGNSALTSFQVLFGFVINLPSGPGILAAKAKYRSLRVRLICLAFLELATTIPS